MSKQKPKWYHTILWFMKSVMGKTPENQHVEYAEKDAALHLALVALEAAKPFLDVHTALLNGCLGCEALMKVSKAIAAIREAGKR